MTQQNHSWDMARGSIIYFLGLPGKFAGILLLWLAARFYGQDELGIYLAAWALIQIPLNSPMTQV